MCWCSSILPAPTEMWYLKGRSVPVSDDDDEDSDGDERLLLGVWFLQMENPRLLLIFDLQMDIAITT